MAAKLPVEVVAQILGYLSVSDRQEVALVNHAWYEASLDPILLRDVVMSFPSNTITPEILHGLAQRRMPNLVLENLDSSHTELIRNSDYIQHHLISLSLKGCDVSESIFVELLSNCSQLVKLDLSCCNNLFMSGMLLSKQTQLDTLRRTLMNVKELNLSSIRHLTDSVFNRLMGICSNLEKLHIAGNQIIFHADVHINNRGIPSSAVFSFSNILKQLGEKASTLHSLSLSRTTIDDNSLESLAQIADLELKELMLVNCREITNTGIEKFCKLQSSLVNLDLTQCMGCGDFALVAICRTQHNLEKLSVGKLRINDNSVSHLHNLKNLTSLNASSCPRVSSHGFMKFFHRIDKSRLVDLNLNCCSSIRDDLLMDMIHKVPNLTHIDLSSTGVTDLGVILMSRFLSQLVSLKLAWCRNVTDDGLLGVVSDKLTLEAADGGCKCTRKPLTANLNEPYRSVTNEKLLSILEGRVVPLFNLQQLQCLDLTQCGKLTDISLTTVLSGLLQLQVLLLANCTKLTDDTLLTISQYNVILEELDISGGDKYTDVGLIAVAKHLRRLRSLKIANCEKFTDKGIDSLSRYSRRLRQLDISLNNQVSMAAVGRLEGELTHLQVLQKRLVGGSDGEYQM